MSSTQSVQSAWKAYRQAVTKLYSAPAKPGGASDRSAGEIYIGHLEEDSNEVLTTSEQFRNELIVAMATDDLSQRELAALKLVAAAAYDLSVASALFEMETAEPTDQVDRSASSILATSRELQSILNAPLEDGIIGLLKVDRAALSVDPQSARKQLEQTIGAFLNDIPENAAELSQTAIAGFIDVGLGALTSVASVAAQEILAHVPEGVSLLTQRVTALIAEAVRKLQSALGKEQEQQITKEVNNWLDDVKNKRDTVTSLLDKLYETPRIGEETKKLVATAAANTEAGRYNQATEKLEQLLARYSKMKSTLNATMRVLAFFKPTLLAAVPWGPLSVYAAYSSFLAYAVYSGGDYLDWDRLGDHAWLDRVKGLKTTVREALNAPPSAPRPKDAAKGHDRDGDTGSGPGIDNERPDGDPGSGS